MAAFEVLSLDTAIPQIRAPGAGDTYTFPRQALFLAGTVSAPGIAQTSNDNTGMWWPAANTLAWSINGGEAMRLNSTGLGIGTSNPTAKLQVAGNAIIKPNADGLEIGALGTGVAYLQAYGAASAAIALAFYTGTTERMRLDASGNFVVNTAAIATNATDGFIFVPGCAGTPTGTPTTYTGRVPIVVDTTNNKLYFYSGGAWRDAGP